MTLGERIMQGLVWHGSEGKCLTRIGDSLDGKYWKRETVQRALNEMDRKSLGVWAGIEEFSTLELIAIAILTADARISVEKEAERCLR